MDFLIVKTINCNMIDDSIVKFTEMEIQDNYYKIPNESLVSLNYSNIRIKPLEGYEFVTGAEKKNTKNGWIVFNNGDKIHLNEYEMYNYDSQGYKDGKKYDFNLSIKPTNISVGRSYGKPTLNEMNIKYIIAQAHPDPNDPLPEPDLLTNEELKIFGIGTEEPEETEEPETEEPETEEPEPEEPEPEENIINANIDGLTNLENAIKNKENVIIVANDGYFFDKTEDTGYITIFGKKCYLKDGSINLRDIDNLLSGRVTINFIENDDGKATKIEIKAPITLESLVSEGHISATKLEEPEEPNPPETQPTEYPKETLVNCYIDEWRIQRNTETNEILKNIQKYTSFKDWLNNADGVIKGDINFQTTNGYDFGIDYNDGYIVLNNDEKLTFYEMYEQAEPAGDYRITSKNYTYKDTKIYYIDKEKDQYIRFLSYTKNKIYIDFNNGFTMGIDGQKAIFDDPPFNNLMDSVIKEIYVNAYIENEKSISNLAYDTYVISDEELAKIRDNGDLYNDLIINTYNYPLIINNNDLIDTEFSIDTASFNVVAKKFTKIATEIPIFEFDIPDIKGVESVEIFPIYSSKIIMDYTVVQGKHIKGISVYDCMTNTNVLKILANDTLIDYFDYNIQSEIPINYNINRVQSNGNIGNRVPLFKSFVIIKSTQYMAIDDKKQNFYKGDIIKINSQILKKEFEILENLFKTGIYINEEDKNNE